MICPVVFCDSQSNRAILRDVKAALLKKNPLFQALSESDLQELATQVVERSFRAGESIFDQGTQGSEMYIIIAGQVNIFLPGDQSRRVSLKDLGPGEYFGELGLFDDKPRSASALATTNVSLLSLTRDMLTDYLQRRPQAILPILQTMADRLRDTNNLLSQRAARNVVKEIEERLSWHDKLADRVAELNGSWTFILLLLLITVSWAFINSYTLNHNPIDPYPYVFFNLLLAILVALQGPLIIMSQNRQSNKDRAQAEADFNVNLKNEVNIETILRELGEFRQEMTQVYPQKNQSVSTHSQEDQ